MYRRDRRVGGACPLMLLLLLLLLLSGCRHISLTTSLLFRLENDVSNDGSVTAWFRRPTTARSLLLRPWPSQARFSRRNWLRNSVHGLFLDCRVVTVRAWLFADGSFGQERIRFTAMIHAARCSRRCAVYTARSSRWSLSLKLLFPKSLLGVHVHECLCGPAGPLAPAIMCSVL